MKVVIIDYGAGNIQSVKFAMKRIGITPVVSKKRSVIRNADKVIFPGVGQAETAMKFLRNDNLDTLIPTLEQPVLGICLGMQLLCCSTEEGEVPGLGVFGTKVRQIKPDVKVPHMGWNTIENLKGSILKGLPEQSHLYFVHSFAADCCDQTIATTTYGTTFSAVLEKDNFYACQFHPEKSGETGQIILENFIKL